MLSTNNILTGLGLMIVLAIGCQLLAARLRLPAIVLLLPAGFIAGAGIALAVALATAGLQTILGALLTAAVACGYDASARKSAPYRGICTHAG